MSSNYKITIQRITPTGEVDVESTAEMNQEVVLHLLRHHKIDGVDEVFKIAKEQFYQKLLDEQTSLQNLENPSS